MIIVAAFFTGLLAGLMAGVLFFAKFAPSVPSKKVAKRIYEKYKQKRDNCPKYLIKRAGIIAKEVSENSAGYNDKDIIPVAKDIDSLGSDSEINNKKCEFHKPEHCVHDYSCCGCNHTLVECCEVSEREIVQIIEEIVTGKQDD